MEIKDLVGVVDINKLRIVVDGQLVNKLDNIMCATISNISANSGLIEVVASMVTEYKSIEQSLLDCAEYIRSCNKRATASHIIEVYAILGDIYIKKAIDIVNLADKSQGKRGKCADRQAAKLMADMVGNDIRDIQSKIYSIQSKVYQDE